MKTTLIFSAALFVILILFSCGKKAEHAVHKVVDKYTCPMHPQIVQDKPGACPICGMDLVKVEGSGMDDSIMLNESQIKLANITTTITQLGNMGENTILTGQLKVNEDQTEMISSRAQGRIEKLYVKEVGQQVKRGQALYELYSESLLVLQQEYLLALLQVEELKQDRYESFVKAAEKKLILFGMAKEQIKQLAEKRKSDSRITFISPVSGVVARIDAIEGGYVSEGSLLCQIESLDQIWVEAELYPGETSLVKTGDIVTVKINGYENETVKGKVTFLSPEYRQSSQIITMRAVINNPHQKFLPGMLATVVLSHSERKVISLPVDAVIRDAKGSHVWILEEDGGFKPRMVKTGMENFEKVEIMEGLDENENVVITGGYLLYGELVLKKGLEPMEGHHH